MVIEDVVELATELQLEPLGQAEILIELMSAVGMGQLSIYGGDRVIRVILVHPVIQTGAVGKPSDLRKVLVNSFSAKSYPALKTKHIMASFRKTVAPSES